MSTSQYIFSLGTKVSEQHIDPIIKEFYSVFNEVKKNSGEFIFDFTNTEWIAHQELLVITSILKYLVEEEVSFKVNFLINDSVEHIDKRKAGQIIQIWEVWKIYQVIPNVDYYKEFFDIDGKTVDVLKNKFNINSNNLEIYNRYGVTPFVTLNQIRNYNDKEIREMLNSVYKLNAATNEILKANNCLMPFENQTLSSIITKELYENFLDHFEKSLFTTENNFAFMSLSLKAKLKDQPNVQRILENNFVEESISQLKNFFYDSDKKVFKNQSLLQLSFLDFGKGISNTLASEYKKKMGIEDVEENNLDTEILKYAFRHDSSKDPINKRYLEKAIIPRGLFDLLSIVKRFNGLIVARSNYGKLIYDFSTNSSIDEAFIDFSDGTAFFPGTLISIYIPERTSTNYIDNTVIKPYELGADYSIDDSEIEHISLFEIQKETVDSVADKSNVYNIVFENFVKKITAGSAKRLIYLDFNGYEIDERISKKIIYFIISDYNINLKNNLIVINPPPVSFLNEIRNEIALLSETIRQYKIHPTPFIKYNKETTKLEVYWLGVFSNSDIDRLNQLLFDDHDLRRSDFESPSGIVGNVNYYDKYGNLKSFISRTSLIDKFKEQIAKAETQEIETIIRKCIIQNDNQLFLCSGNYYQYEYIQMFDVLSDYNNCDFLANTLFERIKGKITDLSNYKFLSISTNSSKITNHLINIGKISKERVVTLDNYQAIFNDEIFNHQIASGDNLILICDVTSTCYLNQKLRENFEAIGANLKHTAVLVDAIDENFEKDKMDYNAIRDDMVSLFVYPLKKYRRSQIRDKITSGEVEVIRIHPYTFIPITTNVSKISEPTSEVYVSNILLTNSEFIDIIGQKYIKAGYYKFNNLIHPYFFDMDGILSDEDICKTLISNIFSKISPDIVNDIDLVFYPKNSGIRNLNFDYFKNDILKSHAVKIFELERFETNDGWRFPHPPKFLYNIAAEKKALILDDGSCSGESIIQMIDEVASLNVTEIVVLSIIGRVSDHKRDFFFRLKALNNDFSDAAKLKNVDIKIYFGSHWHIPTYYVEESPVIKEKNWLEDVASYPNIPEKIKNIVQNIQDELRVKKVTESSNRYLLKTKDNQDILRELILRKEEIGKISTYRFYKDYFYFFNDIIKTYELKEKSPDRYKKMELICAVFLHEPYLFPRLRTVLPDLSEKIEEFIQTILFGNPTITSKPKLSKDSLSYNWKNKDLIHLFFIVFSDARLFETLDSTKLTELINEFCISETDLDYLFFKLLKYYPVKKETKDALKYSGNVKSLLNAVIDNATTDSGKNKKLKRFRSFTTTLPRTHDDFNSAITRVKTNYSKLIDDAYHKESINLQLDIIQTQLDVLSGTYKLETEHTIIKTWEKISPFIEDLLSFSKTYPSYFAPCGAAIYGRLEVERNSLRLLHGELSDLIFSLNASSNIVRIQELIRSIYDDFISSNSEYFKIFNNNITSNLMSEFDSFLKRLLNAYPKMNIRNNSNEVPDTAVNIPIYILQEVIFEELIQNFRHCNLTDHVKFDWFNENKDIKLIITNKIGAGGDNNTTGGGSGITKLNSLNDMPHQGVRYEKNKTTTEFIQTLRFLKI